ncbi:Mbeg1-like protein [Parvimonas sp. C2]|uniref:Mbeg1-like protein n=1 Tax=Parvimonas sp. C2 TaxID=3110692 RepID=UPI002B46EE8B|nr:Mbeg1-like protein [Parvimonas sp. C2]MEB3073151.1 Mbeg1-like protein [Parvimonas sp. C2]
MDKIKITDLDYNVISSKVYWVRKNKKNNKKPLVKGRTFKSSNTWYEVLEVLDHENGMQAMAVAPIINGKVDTSRIVIAYAGTDEWKDVETDAQMIGLGDTEKLTHADSPEDDIIEYDAQSKTALDFAKKIRAEYPDSIITTTGHSLGESTAMYVALKMRFNNTGFNGPDIHNMISKDEIEYMRKHPEQFINYRNYYDYVGNITGNKTQTAIYLNYGFGIYTHSLSDWEFNEEGKLIDNYGEAVKTSLKLKQEMFDKLDNLQNIKTKLAQGGYTENEEIFLDSEQARIISKGVKEISTTAYENIKNIRDKAVAGAEEIWDSTLEVPFGFILSPQEVRAAYMEGGVTYDTTVGQTKRELDPKVEKAKEINENFIELDEKVNKTIDEMLEKDEELKKDFDLWTKEMK